MAASRPKPVVSEGVRQKVPDWLAALGIKEGEYLTTSKLREQRASKARCISEAGGVHACLGLHTMGYQQQLAVKMAAGKRVPLAPADVAAEVGIRRDKVMRAMAQLKAWGLADWDGSTKGDVKLYAWAVPRPVSGGGNIVPKSGYNIDLPPFVLSLLKRYKIRLAADFVPARGYITAVEEAARAAQEGAQAAQEAPIVLKRVLNCTHAREELYPNSGCIYKEERNERNIEERSSSSSSAFARNTTEAKAEEEEEPPPQKIAREPEPTPQPPINPPDPVKEVKAAYPPHRWDDARATKAHRETINSAADQQELLEGLQRHKDSERWR